MGDDRHRVWQQQVAFQNMNLSVLYGYGGDYDGDNKYYFEKPYGGTFLTTEENYNKINDIFNRAE